MKRIACGERLLRAVLRVPLLCLCGTVALEAFAGEARMDEIVRAWKAREQRVGTAAFEWRQSEFVPRGTRPFTKWEGVPLRRTEVTYPPNDVTFEFTCALKFDGVRKMRFEYRGPMVCQEVNDYVTNWYLSVSDGTVAKAYFDKDRSGDDRYSARCHIGEGTENGDVRGIHLLALLLCYRPFTIALGDEFDLAKYSLGEATAFVGGRECLLLKGSPGGDPTYTLYVDPEREFLPVRWQSATSGDPRIQLDIDFTRDDRHGWLPAAWRYTTYGHAARGQPLGKVDSKVSAVVTKRELNGSIPIAEFRFDDYPVGTLVVDGRTKEHYILREGGEKRVITEDEMRVGYPYERYAATESGMAGEREPFRPIWMWIGICALIAAGAVVWRLARLKR